jgi:hypothetical protein
VVGAQRADQKAVAARPFSAASGIVRIGERIYVVADDDTHLAVFDVATQVPGALLSLLSQPMPSDAAQRKRVKPDFEALAHLPAFGGYPQGALLAFGSGSGLQRRRAVLLALDRDGAVQGVPREIDTAPLVAPLAARFPDLNIEGAFVSGDRFLLLQRGHSAVPVNAAIIFSWAQMQAWLEEKSNAPTPLDVQTFTLGAIEQTPLCFTDGTPLPNGAWAFCAAAEDTSDSYNDGACKGSAVGVVNADGQIEALDVLNVNCKAEGIALLNDSDLRSFLLVTDADDPLVPARLLAVHLQPNN